MEIKNESKNFLVLNNIRSAENVGACFRICDSCNVSLILQGITPHPKIIGDSRLPYICESDFKKINKTATESINNIDFMYIQKLEDTVSYLNSKKLNIYCLETNIKESKNIFDHTNLNKPFALIVGNEKTGIDPDFLKWSKNNFYIPMYGKNKSLNVAVASAVALYRLISL